MCKNMRMFCTVQLRHSASTVLHLFAFSGSPSSKDGTSLEQCIAQRLIYSL